MFRRKDGIELMSKDAWNEFGAKAYKDPKWEASKLQNAKAE